MADEYHDEINDEIDSKSVRSMVSLSIKQGFPRGGCDRPRVVSLWARTSTARRARVAATSSTTTVGVIVLVEDRTRSGIVKALQVWL